MKKQCSICGERGDMAYSEAVRYRFARDDSSHWYMIPTGKEEEFELWVSSAYDDEEYIGEDFNEYRIDGYPGFYTFTDPQKE